MVAKNDDLQYLDCHPLNAFSECVTELSVLESDFADNMSMTAALSPKKERERMGAVFFENKFSSAANVNTSCHPVKKKIEQGLEWVA